MKHKLTVLICVIAIVSLGLYAKQIHDQYLTKENAAASVARSINLKAQQEAAKKQTQFLQGVSLDEQQCSKDKLAYYSLTAIVRAKTVAPDCVVDVN